MAKTIAVVNQKGGVGKTTTAVNLAACVGKSGFRVLLVDVDSQGNASSGFGISRREIKYSSYDIIVNGVKASDAVIKTKFENIDIIPASINLVGTDIEILEREHRESLLRTALCEVWDNYDFIFLDCPPSLGLVTINALAASDTYLVPIQPEFFALEGLSLLLSTVRKVKSAYELPLELEGVLLTMYDGRLSLTRQVTDEIKKYFPKKVYSTVITRNVRLSEAPSYGEPVIYYDKRSNGAKNYTAFAEEFLRANKKI